MNVYLCGSDNTKTIIDDADVTEVDFIHEVEQITGTLGTGGSLTIGFPDGTMHQFRGPYEQLVSCDSDVSLSFQADANYELENVVVDGVSLGATSTYNLNDVQQDHTVSATFRYLEPSFGACCYGDWWNPQCTFVSITECYSIKGAWNFAQGVQCFEGPCYPTRTRTLTWGRLKILYR